VSVLGRLIRWPPAVYLLVSVGSIFASLGMLEHWMLAVGVGLQVIALCIALVLALERRTNRPRPTWLLLVIAAVAAFYGITAVAASDLGIAYVVAALGAFLIPGTATALAVATARTETLETEDGELVDLSREDRGPVPRLGLDSSRPLGDSPDLHDDISEHDLPIDHPGRKAVEHEVERTGRRVHDSPSSRR
jgi:hypothetical protein